MRTLPSSCRPYHKIVEFGKAILAQVLLFRANMPPEVLKKADGAWDEAILRLVGILIAIIAFPLFYIGERWAS